MTVRSWCINSLLFGPDATRTTGVHANHFEQSTEWALSTSSEPTTCNRQAEALARAASAVNYNAGMRPVLHNVGLDQRASQVRPEGADALLRLCRRTG